MVDSQPYIPGGLRALTLTLKPKTSQNGQLFSKGKRSRGIGDSSGNHLKGQICTNRICACRSMQLYKLQVILGLCLAQRIVSKLSEKKKKKSQLPTLLNFFSSPLTLFSNSFRNIASWLAASNIISSPVHFWIEQSVPSLSPAISGLSVPPFQPSLWFLQDQTQNSASILFPLQMGVGGRGAAEWLLGSQSSIKHPETKTWLKYWILTVRRSHKLDSKKHWLGPSRSQKYLTFYMLLKKKNNIKAWTQFVFLILDQLNSWLMANSQKWQFVLHETFNISW